MGRLAWRYQVSELFLLSVLYSQVAPFLSFSSSLPASSRLCHEDQRIALLQFKNSLSIVTSPSVHYCGRSLTDYWKEDVDCCSWYGVTCDNSTGHVVELRLMCSGLQGSIHSNSSLFLLPHLQSLWLSGNNLSGPIPDGFGKLRNLSQLSLSVNSFNGPIPDCFGKLQNLTVLDLRINIFNGPIPDGFGKLRNLNYLDLSFNRFTGPIPDGFGKLQNLAHLDLSFNRFTGPIPSSIFNLTRLSHFRASDNLLVGHLPSGQVTGLSSLGYLDLSGNQLNGTLPSWLFSLPSLRRLGLQENQFTGQIPEFQSKSLEQIVLSKNELHGPIPNSIFELVNVSLIYLSSNKLGGVLELDMFSKLQQLQALDLSGNSLSVITNTQVNSSWPSLQHLGLSSCDITDFPIFLSTQEDLEDLNLSHNLLRTVNLPPSGNKIIFDLRWNLIEGPLPVPNAETGTAVFLISGNKLTGEIPSSICNLTVLEILDLSNNSLSGKVPECLGSFSLNLAVLSLQMNSFHGPMPGNFSRGNNLRNLNLNGNQFEGQVPQTLIHCKSLEVLDLGNNNISDGFPQRLESLPNLQVLILRSNRFHGPIGNPISRSPFQRLRILDLSHNSFSGLLPTKYLAKLTAMRNIAEQNITVKYMGEQNVYYQDSVTVTMKGLEIVLVRILTIFTTIDLSSNKFDGQVPDIIGNFTSLKVLNLSHNNISGQIPSSLGNLAAVESLDLSSNMLVGKIPSQLTNLNFLAVFNLSHNLLEGPIPRGKQFDTFSNDSYLNNLELCGPPLSKKCRNEEPPVPQLPPSKLYNEDYSKSWFNWKIAAALGYGCGVVLGCSMAYIAFSTGKPWRFVKRVGEWQYKVTRLTQRHKHRKVW